MLNPPLPSPAKNKNLRFGFCFLLVLFLWSLFRFAARLLLFLLQLGTEELNHSQFGAITNSPAGVNDAGIAAIAIGEARSKIRKELLRRVWRHKKRSRLPASVERIALAERNEALRKRTNRFRTAN